MWYSNTTEADKKALQRVFKAAEKIIRTDFPATDYIYSTNTTVKCKQYKTSRTYSVLHFFSINTNKQNTI